MALSCFSHAGKQVKLSDGTSYAYLYLPAAPSKPTLLLLHGFPSAAYEWRNQVELSRNGFGLVIPDLLGYGDTDAPSDIEAYSLKTMSGHISEILEKEGVEQVIGVSHDW
jgi:soluble epoxide hydrolase/lipid-phosphate phosphatase